MMILNEILSCSWYTLVLIPIVIWLSGVYILALTGKAVGVRRIFVKILLRIFQVCKDNIEVHKRNIDRVESERNLDDLDHDAAGNDDDNDDSKYSKVMEKSVSDQNSMHSCSDGVKQIPNGDFDYNIIARDRILTLEGLKMSRNKSVGHFVKEEIKEHFQLTHAMDFAKLGIEAIIEDEVTKCFKTEELPSWNLLSRTNENYHYISIKMTILWGLGVVARYGILLPIRSILTVFGISNMVLCTALIGCLPPSSMKVWLNKHISLAAYRILSRAFSAIVTYHNQENKAVCGSVCVANHTSPIDVVILACDNGYALVGQSHGGLIGIIQRALSRASPQVWFERSETYDRTAVARRLKKHVSSGKNLPILIFPEGTCINNTSVMQFKKGSFEIGCTIHPVAIKYDPRFGDAFWDSSQQTMVQYLVMMMTSWAIVCNVWYLPPMTRREDESSIDFANRVKSEIANKGGLVDLEWDGQLKRQRVKSHMVEVQRKAYSDMLKVE